MNARKLTGRFNWRRQLKEPLAGTWMCATLRNSGLDTPLLPRDDDAALFPAWPDRAAVSLLGERRELDCVDTCMAHT